MKNSPRPQRASQELVCFLRILIQLLLFSAGAQRAIAQCHGMVASVAVVATCTAQNNAPFSKTEIDPQKPYRVEELIDMAETNNPRTQIAWERAKQAADRLGIARSDYYLSHR
jgi:outer membrane protein TolC